MCLCNFLFWRVTLRVTAIQRVNVTRMVYPTANASPMGNRSPMGNPSPTGDPNHHWLCVLRRRMRLYKFMLEGMADEHRFQVMSKLIQEVKLLYFPLSSFYVPFSVLAQVGRFPHNLSLPSVSVLSRPLSRRPFFRSSFKTSLHLFLGLPFPAFPGTTILEAS